MSTVEVIVKLRCLVRHDSDVDVFVSSCPSLDIYSQGETEDQAIAAIESAVFLYLRAAYAHDRLDQILRRAGFTQLSRAGESVKSQDEFVAVAPRPTERSFPINVPLVLLAQQNASNRSSSA